MDIDNAMHTFFWDTLYLKALPFPRSDDTQRRHSTHNVWIDTVIDNKVVKKHTKS